MTLTVQEDRTLLRLFRHMAAVRNHWSSVVAIKEGLRDGDDFKVIECWTELNAETRTALWVAPKSGGVWTTAERTTIKGLGG